MKRQDESIKTFNLPFESGIEAISGRHITNDFRRHIHKTYIIGMVEQGKRIITHPGGATRVAENELFIIIPGQVHSCSSEDQSGHSYKVLSVPSQAMGSIASQISEKQEESPCFNKIRYQDEGLSENFRALFGVIEGLESDIEVESKIYSFLAHLLICFSESPPLIHQPGEQRDAIKRVCGYIRQHFREHLSLKHLAEIACLSPFHFQREFKKSMGITPWEYLNDFKISESKKMLLKSGEIADTAIETGFVDQSHFSRAFRKTVGIPPGKYCKINKMG
jgi:AraC-like DNA-binding protein/aspartate 1-decarboxylase